MCKLVTQKVETANLPTRKMHLTSGFLKRKITIMKDSSVYFERREVSHSTMLIHKVKVKYFLRLEVQHSWVFI